MIQLVWCIPESIVFHSDLAEMFSAMILIHPGANPECDPH
jgi:hypothetical protein